MYIKDLTVDNWLANQTENKLAVQYIGALTYMSLLEVVDTSDAVLTALQNTHQKFIQNKEKDIQDIMDAYFVSDFSDFFNNLKPANIVTYNQVLHSIQAGDIPDYRWSYCRAIALTTLDSVTGSQQATFQLLSKTHNDQCARLSLDARQEAITIYSEFFNFDNIQAESQ